jgi:hypothetical protein
MPYYIIPGDGNCMFNAVLLAASNIIKNHPNPTIRGIKAQADLRKLVQDYYREDPDELKAMTLAQMLIDTIKLDLLVGYSELTTELKELKKNYDAASKKYKEEVLEDGVSNELINRYIEFLTKDGGGIDKRTWGSGSELQALSKILGVKILLHGQPTPIDHTDNPAALSITIKHCGGNHYNAFADNPDPTILHSTKAQLKENPSESYIVELSKDLQMQVQKLDGNKSLLLYTIIFNKREAEQKLTDFSITTDEIKYALGYLQEHLSLSPPKTKKTKSLAKEAVLLSGKEEGEEKMPQSKPAKKKQKEKAPIWPTDPKVNDTFKLFLQHFENKSIRVQMPEDQDVPKVGSVTKIQRRMDSLARIAEGKHICAAVFIKDKKIYISTNGIHKDSEHKESESTKHQKRLIAKIADYFCSVKKGVTSEQEKSDLFEKKLLLLFELILPRAIRSSSYEQQKKLQLSNEIKVSIIEFYKSDKKTKEWAKNQENAKVITRLIRDFEKLEHSVKEDAKNDAFILSLQKGEISIEFTDIDGVHAEMRAFDGVPEGDYIGISKLGCNHCSLVINSKGILSRGKHGTIYTWVQPNFLSTNKKALEEFLGEKAYEKYCTLDVTQKEELLKYATFAIYRTNDAIPAELFSKYKPSRKLYADDSDSDVSASGEIALRKKVIDEFKNDEKINNKLKKIGLNDTQIESIKQCDDKWQLLKDPNIFKLLSDNLMEFEKFLGLHTKVLKLFENDFFLSSFEDGLITIVDLNNLNVSNEEDFNELTAEGVIYLIYRAEKFFSEILDCYNNDLDKFKNFISNVDVADFIAEEILSYEELEALYEDLEVKEDFYELYHMIIAHKDNYKVINSILDLKDTADIKIAASILQQERAIRRIEEEEKNLSDFLEKVKTENRDMESMLDSLSNHEAEENGYSQGDDNSESDEENECGRKSRPYNNDEDAEEEWNCIEILQLWIDFSEKYITTINEIRNKLSYEKVQEIFRAVITEFYCKEDKIAAEFETVKDLLIKRCNENNDIKGYYDPIYLSMKLKDLLINSELLGVEVAHHLPPAEEGHKYLIIDSDKIIKKDSRDDITLIYQDIQHGTASCGDNALLTTRKAKEIGFESYIYVANGHAVALICYDEKLDNQTILQAITATELQEEAGLWEKYVEVMTGNVLYLGNSKETILQEFGKILKDLDTTEEEALGARIETLLVKIDSTNITALNELKPVLQGLLEQLNELQGLKTALDTNNLDTLYNSLIVYITDFADTATEATKTLLQSLLLSVEAEFLNPLQSSANYFSPYFPPGKPDDDPKHEGGGGSGFGGQNPNDNYAMMMSGNNTSANYSMAE